MAPPPNRVRLILVRHGLTAWNLDGRYQGHTDTSLCAQGVDEARAAGAALRHTRACLLLSSPLRRARATAEVIARALGSIPCQIEERLIEIGFGDWEGLTQAEVRRRSPGLLRQWKRAPESFRFPGGEGLCDGWRRLSEFLRAPPWAGRADVRCVIAVTHTGPIRLASLWAGARPLAQYRQVPLQPGAAHQFEWEPSGELRPVGLLALT
jgi:broad specificity phosphatase PhoE